MFKNKAISLFPIYCLVLLFFFLAALVGNKAITTVSLEVKLQNRHCIIIDAGHGGIDGGTTSCTGIPESAINLEIAKRLDDMVHLLGYQTVMIRTEDISVYTEGTTIAQKKVSDLKERVRIVNQTPKALLVSIHQNYFADSQYKGAQVFFSDSKGSFNLAKAMQQSLVSVLNPGSTRKCKKAKGIYLMDKIQCPGILVECGFLSNPEEEINLRKGEYQKKICAIIAASISTFLNT